MIAHSKHQKPKEELLFYYAPFRRLEEAIISAGRFGTKFILSFTKTLYKFGSELAEWIYSFFGFIMHLSRNPKKL